MDILPMCITGGTPMLRSSWKRVRVNMIQRFGILSLLVAVAFSSVCFAQGAYQVKTAHRIYFSFS